MRQRLEIMNVDGFFIGSYEILRVSIVMLLFLLLLGYNPDHSRNSAFLYLQRKEHMEQLCSVLDTIDISCVDKTGMVWLFYPSKGHAFSFSSLLILEWTYFRGATAFSVPQIGS